MLFRSDRSLLKEVEAELEAEKRNAEHVIKKVLLRKRDRHADSENSYFRDRSNDIADLCKKVLRSLLGTKHLLHTVPADSVVIAEHLLPSDIEILSSQHVSAIVVE